MENNDCINWKALFPDIGKFDSLFHACGSCKHFLLINHALSYGLCCFSASKSSEGGDQMENKRKSQYTALEMEKRETLLDYLSNELSVETLLSCTTEFLSDLANFVENYGFDD